MPEKIDVSVVYALPDQQRVVRLTVPAGSTVEQAVADSGLSVSFPELAAQRPTYAVFGRIVPGDHVLAAGDRVELLRPLQIDPKENRRRAARTQAKR